MHLALQYSVVVGMNMPIFGVYVCSNESILSLTLDPEGRIFSDSTVIISFTTLTSVFRVISFESFHFCVLCLPKRAHESFDTFS